MKYISSFPLIFLNEKMENNVFLLSVNEFLISYFVAQPSVVLGNISEIWIDIWKAWRKSGDFRKLEIEQEREETDGYRLGAEHL